MENKNLSSQNKKTILTVFQLTLMTTVAVSSVRGLPQQALSGWGSILMYLIPGLFFFIPMALVAAELGAAFPGGIYAWARAAFGNRFGFVAIWLQWVHNAIWYTVELSFVVATLSFLVGNGGLSSNGMFLGFGAIILYWFSTLIVLQGGDLFAKVSSRTGLFGVVVPAALLIIFAAIYLSSGHPVADTLTHSSFLPDFSKNGLSSMVVMVANILAFAGMEMNAVHVRDMKNPASIASA